MDLAFSAQRLGNNIRAERNRLHLTQKELADAVNVSASSVAAWESGDSIPISDSLFSLALVLGKGMDELCGFVMTA